jgi:Fe-S-cluster containining protein
VVKLAGEEADRIAAFLGLDAGLFIAGYTELHPQRTGLVLKARANGECLFLEGKNRCRVNAVKPAQCEGFPNRWNFPGWREVCEAVAAGE